MSFQPSSAQALVMHSALQWWKTDPSRPFLIQGYAGTGKTAMLEHLADHLDAEAAYVAFTGKAASVIRGKVGAALFVGTIHSAIYAMKMEGDVDKYEALKQEADQSTNPAYAASLRAQMQGLIWFTYTLRDRFAWDDGADAGTDRIIFVDECSMVADKLGADLMRLAEENGYCVIAVGDPAQLPPVEGDPYFTPDRCHCAPVMEEIIRQREGSPILLLASGVRQGWAPVYGQWGNELTITTRDHVNPDAYDQIVCGTNKTRHALNTAARARRGWSAMTPPQPGERMIILDNDHRLGVYNGEIFTVMVCAYGEIVARFEDGREVKIPLNLEIPGQQKIRNRTYVAYAYAITAHKAQGSEFRNLLVMNESWAFRENANRWLYTAATRARNHLTLAQ
jgi:exodeoxyribonuclease V